MPKSSSILRRKPAPESHPTNPAELNAPKIADHVTASSIANGSAKQMTSMPMTTAPGYSESLPKIAVLYRFAACHPDYIVGDDMGTLFGCMGTVLIASLILGTSSSEVISYLTTYPKVFINAVFSEFFRQEFWTNDNWKGMVAASANDLEDIDELNAWLESVMQDFWGGFWSYKAQIYMESLKGRALFGGRIETSTDTDALDYFGLHEAACSMDATPLGAPNF